MGIPGGILSVIIGLIGVIYHSINFSGMSLLTSVALLMLGAPFIRVTMMIHLATDRLDDIESKLSELCHESPSLYPFFRINTFGFHHV